MGYCLKLRRAGLFGNAAWVLQRVPGRESLMLEEKEEPSLGGVKIGAPHMQPLPKLWERVVI